MSYLITGTDGSLVAEVQDQTANTTATSLTLIGRAYLNFGEALNTDLVHLLESFAATTPPANALTGQLWYQKGGGPLHVLDDGGNWDALATQAWVSAAFASNTSDARFKENVAPLVSGLETISKLKPVTFTWKTDTGMQDGGKTHSGFIAQDVHPVIPDAVSIASDSDGAEMLQLRKAELVPHLVLAVQELAAENEKLKARLTKLEALGSGLTKLEALGSPAAKKPARTSKKQ